MIQPCTVAAAPPPHRLKGSSTVLHQYAITHGRLALQNHLSDSGNTSKTNMLHHTGSPFHTGRPQVQRKCPTVPP